MQRPMESARAGPAGDTGRFVQMDGFDWDSTGSGNGTAGWRITPFCNDTPPCFMPTCNTGDQSLIRDSRLRP